MTDMGYKSSYDRLVLRTFHSTIPPHLLANMPEDTRFMLEALSRMDSEIEWLKESLIKHSDFFVDVDSRLCKLEQFQGTIHARIKNVNDVTDKINNLWDWKTAITSKWGVLTIIALVFLPVVLKFIFDLLLKWL